MINDTRRVTNTYWILGIDESYAINKWIENMTGQSIISESPDSVITGTVLGLFNYMPWY